MYNPESSNAVPHGLSHIRKNTAIVFEEKHTKIR